MFHKFGFVHRACSGLSRLQRLCVVFVVLCISTKAFGQESTILDASPTILNASPTIISLGLDVNSSSAVINGSFYDGNTSLYTQPNSTYVVVPSVTPSIISQVSNLTATAENVFFVEFKLLSKTWNEQLTNKMSSQFIKLANKITSRLNQVYHSLNDTTYNGSLVLGYRNSSSDGVYVSVKVEFSKGVIVNASLVDPLIDHFRSGGSAGFVTDTVFIKLSKYADCIITYIDTKVCQCSTKTYMLQMKCFDADVIGGEVCPLKCFTGYQVTGAAPCSWDDLDGAKCSARLDRPVAIAGLIAVVTVIWCLL